MTADPETPARRIERLTGRPVIAFGRVRGGYTPAWRRIVRFADGGTAFVKVAKDARTAAWLRAELRLYASIEAPCLARVLAMEEGEAPLLLLLEDLSVCDWPPPWTPTRVDAALAGLEAMHRLRPAVPAYDLPDPERCWHLVAQDPAPFLGLGLVSSAWLERCLPTLLAAQDAMDPHADTLVHLDLRSDNMCFRGGRLVLIDWNNACLARADLDTGFWLPSLHMECGPPPGDILPKAAEVAAHVVGYFAGRAGLPEPPTAPGVRDLQRRQLLAGWAWMTTQLELPPADGPRAPGYSLR